jgi:hypothetical protein
MVTRNTSRIREEGEEQGLSNTEIDANVKKWKVESGLYTKTQGSGGHDVYKQKGEWSTTDITREYR